MQQLLYAILALAVTIEAYIVTIPARSKDCYFEVSLSIIRDAG